MKNGWIAAVLLPLAGCVVYSGPYHETRSETVSSDGQRTTRTSTVTGSGWRSESASTQDSHAYLAYPVYPKTDDLCEIAVVVLSAERARGETQPVDYLFWNHNIRTGPDCASEILTLGFPMANVDTKIRRMILPRQLPDDRLYVEVDGNCTENCLSGTGYAVKKREDGHWQVEPVPLISWKR